MSRTSVAYSYRYGILFLGIVASYLMVLALALAHAQSIHLSDVAFIEATGDSSEYLSLADTLLHAHRFALSPEAPPDFFRTIGYSAYLAALEFLFKSALIVPLSQIVLAGLSGVLLSKIGAQIFSEKVGFLAAVAFALEPTALATSLVALSDTLFVTLFLSASLMLLRKESYEKQYFVGGLLLGLAALVRTVGIYVAPLFLLWIIWERRSQLRRAVLCVLACAVGFGLMVTPWMLRNAYVGGAFALSSIQAYNPLFYNIAEFESYRTGTSSDNVRVAIKEKLGTQDDQALESFSYYGSEKALTREYIVAHPFAYGVFHIEKTAPFFLGTGAQSALGLLRLNAPAPDINLSSLILRGDIRDAFAAFSRSPTEVIEISFWLCVTLLAFVAAPMSWFKRRSAIPAVLCMLSLVVLFAIATGPISMPRYRLPAEPFLFLCAVECVFLIWRTVRVR